MALRWALVAGIVVSAAAAGATSRATVRVAAVAYEVRPAPAESHHAGLSTLIEQAARDGATFISTPGLAPAARRSCLSAEPIPGPSTTFFIRHATRLGVWIGFSVFERAGSGCFVTALLAGPDGGIHQKIRKVLVDEPIDGVVAGAFRDVLDSVDADGVRVAVLFASDLVAGVPRLSARGAEVILIDGGAGLDGAALAGSAQAHAVALVASATTCGEGSTCAAGVYGHRAVRHDRDGGTVFLADVTLPRRWLIPSALGLPPTVPIPATGPSGDDLAELGRQLFTDPAMSSSGSVSCITCHQPQRAFTNGLPRGVGVANRETKRNVPSLLNVAFKPLLQWDGYASSVESFVKYPLSNPAEMDFHYLDKVVPYVRNRPDYAAAFRRSMAIETIEFEDIATALAAYQRTLISGRSPFDRYQFGGDRDALPEAAVRGLAIFSGRGGCARCHAIGRRHALFTDYGYHNLGIGYDRAAGRYRDIGLGGISTNDSSGLFLTPSLRNVALTAPYMHDGSLPTLDEVIAFYNRGSADAPHVTPLPPLGLDAGARRDLLAFLESLTGDQRYDAAGRRLPR